MFGGKRTSQYAIAAAALTLALGVAACGDDDESDSTNGESEAADVTEVTLTADDGAADEFSFELSATPTEETTSVVFDNQGEEPHFLVFARINEGYTLDEAVALEGRQGSAEIYIEKGAGPGQTKTFEITDPIEPGSYAMLCPIPGPGGTPHFELGQLEEFDIG